MEYIYKLIKEHKLLLDIFNVILGAALIILIVFLFIHPENQYLIVAAFLISGVINLTNGLRQIRTKGKKSSGKVLIVAGIVIIIASFLTILLL